MSQHPLYREPHPGGAMSVEEYQRLKYLYPNAKYQYLNGVAKLMAGGTLDHDTIGLNVCLTLKQQFRNGPCSVHSSDAQVKIGTKEDGSNHYVYPDATVTCNVDDRRRGKKMIESPLIIVEVLSPSTEHDDLGEKLDAYKACSSIQEIIFINQYTPRIEVYHRDEEDRTKWRHTLYEKGQDVMLNTLDLQLTMDEIYEGIDFSQPLIEG